MKNLESRIWSLEINMRLFVLLILMLAVPLTACQVGKRGFKSPTFASIKAKTPMQIEAEKAYADKNFSGAITNYETLLQSDPNNPEYLLGLANSQRRKGDSDAAISNYEKIIMMNDKNVEALEGKGLALMDKSQFQAANDALMKVLEVDASRWKTLNALGVTSSLIGEHDLALDYYMSAMQMSSDNPVVMNNLGLEHAFLRNYQSAIGFFNRALTRVGGDKDKTRQIDMNLALVYGISGKSDEAENILRKYMDEAKVYNNLGIYAHLANDNDLATSYLNKALTSSPDVYQAAWDNLKRIEPLAGKN